MLQNAIGLIVEVEVVQILLLICLNRDLNLGVHLVVILFKLLLSIMQDLLVLLFAHQEAWAHAGKVVRPCWLVELVELLRRRLTRILMSEH